MKILSEALMFSHAGHSLQKRKYSGEEYWKHLDRVVLMVSKKTDDAEVIAAAYLHDTVEDTEITLEDIREKFGDRVAGFVAELTHEYTKEAYPDLNRATRKAAETERMVDMSHEAKLIKRCDIADNVNSDLVYEDPEFAIVYLAEKVQQLKVLLNGVYGGNEA